jgi:hypothetical protein
MKIRFDLNSIIESTSDIKEYVYSFQLFGKTYKGDYFETKWEEYSSYSKTAKEAREDVKNRLIQNQSFDWALDGICPFSRNLN